jgi:tripartite-type tricarboxylate transporter receptor subunit TctC
MLANQLYNTLPRDGTALGVIGNSLPLDQVLGSQQIMFDSAKFNWIGRFDDLSLLLLAWKESGIASVEDVLNKEFSIAVPGRGSTGEFALGAIKRLLGARYNLISGYRSGQETKLAMERGEVDATASVQWSQVKATNRDWIEQKKINILVQLGLDRFSDLPNVLLAHELGRTEEQKRILELLMLPARIGRALVAPPDMPADHLAVIRNGFEAMLQDPEFKSDADKLNLTLNPLPASSLQDIVDRIGRMEPSLVEKARAATHDP